MTLPMPRWTTALAAGAVLVAGGTASADVRPATSSGSVEMAGELQSTAATTCFKKSYPNCVSSDPKVAFRLVSRGDTSRCTFRLKTVWGDGETTTRDFAGGPDGTTLTPVEHTYKKPNPFLVPKTYAINWTVSVSSGTCYPSSDSPTFRRTCATKSLSGAAWAQQFPASTRLEDLEAGYRTKVTGFVKAMRAGGIRVTPVTTYRPAERAYMMHYAWRIMKKQITPDKVPAFKPAKGQSPVNICWQHTDANGKYDAAASVAAATRLNTAFGTDPNNRVAPALNTLHTPRLAIDMNTTWSARSITVADKSGTPVTIATTPRTGLNSKLIAVGATYGVIHFAPPKSDPNHWSYNGR
ncbi:hypothetical protein LG634_22225 [Streptomyces bambusae]|uniref:hypothetical protein n=1 Tax=Streptomyces bambusae TaxID=1550616 RepID=UPI001CFC71BD|nr:hypothetical protein [Streptomyces bambusae]MCB5167533.1 hypothetical protein [Streptomyces bambusae]